MKTSIKVRIDEELEVEIVPKTEDLMMFSTLSNKSPMSMVESSRAMKKMLARSWKDIKPEELDTFVALNYKRLLDFFTIEFGLATKEELEESQKVAMDKASNFLGGQ